ncbi:MAG: hypothetical protein ABIJ00_13765 [Candidatus Eisenbacteria bacterium]
MSTQVFSRPTRRFGFVDLLPVLRGHRDKKLFFDQCHPGISANAIIGEEIGRYLERELSRL